MAQSSAGRQLRPVRPLQRHKGLIALTTAAVVASALFTSLAQARVYRATAVVALPSGPPAQGQPPLSVSRELAILRSSGMRAAVAARGGVTRAVTVAARTGPRQLLITAEASSAKGAADVANGYATVYVEQRRKELAATVAGPADDLRAKIDGLQHQIDALNAEIAQARPPAAPALTVRRDTLVHALNDTHQQLDQVTAVDGPRVATPARPPGAAIKPHPVRAVLIALAVGLALGILLALVLDYRARRPPAEEPAAAPPFVPAADRAPEPKPARPAPPSRRPEPKPVPEPEPAAPVAEKESTPRVEEPAGAEKADDAEVEPAVERSGPGVPVLGMIPAVPAWRGRESPILRRDQPTTPAAEAYRSLAATVQRILPHRPLRSIAVTSPTQGDGKTTVAANLGVVLARAGKNVVLVSCDLRRPRLHQLFGLNNEAGFTSVLRGEAPLSRAVQQVPGEARLELLASGPPPTAAGQLLSAQRTVEVLTALQAQADVLVIDVPPVEPTGDAAVVASIVDAALVIAGAPSGQASDLARAVDLLDAIDGLVVGVVLNNVSDADTDGRVAMLRRDMPRVSLA